MYDRLLTEQRNEWIKSINLRRLRFIGKQEVLKMARIKEIIKHNIEYKNEIETCVYTLTTTRFIITLKNLVT